MEHESFENPEIADILNEHFVSIKVDREERPDLDQIYMTAVQRMTGQGGWPMSVFLTPDLQPFYRRHLLPARRHATAVPGFRRVLLSRRRLAGRTRRDEIDEVGRRDDRRAPRHRPRCGREPGDLDAGAAAQARRDARPAPSTRAHGGFGTRAEVSAPDGPAPAAARWHSASATTHALHMVRHTLDRMAMGGIYDHLGGGFAPLQHRRPLARAALREDALRQRPARPVLPGGVPGHRRAVLPRGRRGDAGLRPARDDQPGRAVLQHAGRRQRGRGGQVLRLDRARRSSRCSATRTPTSSTPSTASTPEGNWERAQHPAPLQDVSSSTPGCCKIDEAGAATPARRGAGRSCSTVREQAHPAGARREGADGVERPDDRRLRRRPPRCWTSRPTPTPPPAPPTSSCGRCARPTAGCFAPGAPARRRS